MSLDLGDGRTLLDVTVVNPFTAARFRALRHAGSPAVAAKETFDNKVRKYADLLDCHSEGAQQRFVPLAVTAAGAWDERSTRWLRKFSAVCAEASGSDAGSFFSELMVRLAVALWRGNSAMLRSCYDSDLARRQLDRAPTIFALTTTVNICPYNNFLIKTN